MHHKTLQHKSCSPAVQRWWLECHRGEQKSPLPALLRRHCQSLSLAPVYSVWWRNRRVPAIYFNKPLNMKNKTHCSGSVAVQRDPLRLWSLFNLASVTLRVPAGSVTCISERLGLLHFQLKPAGDAVPRSPVSPRIQKRFEAYLQCAQWTPTIWSLSRWESLRRR